MAPYLYAACLVLVMGSAFAVPLVRGKDLEGEPVRWTAGRLVVTVLASLVGAAFLWFIAGMVLGAVLPRTWVRESSVPIVAMQDGNGIKGSFYLFGGTIDDTFKYRYLALRGDGGGEYGETDADRSVIYQEDRTDGVLETWERMPAPGYEGWALGHLRTEYRYRVPKGTVAVEGDYRVDLQ